MAQQDYSFKSFDSQFRRLFNEYDSVEVAVGDRILSVDLEDVPYNIESATDEESWYSVGTAKSVDGLISIFWMEIESEDNSEWSFIF